MGRCAPPRQRLRRRGAREAAPRAADWRVKGRRLAWVCDGEFAAGGQRGLDGHIDCSFLSLVLQLHPLVPLLLGLPL